VEEPRRIYVGETGSEYRCVRCGEWSRFQRDADSRSVRVEQVEGGELIGDRDTPADLDPPLLPTTYRCSRPGCGHVHSALPSSD
jgi:hypothetical protein